MGEFFSGWRRKAGLVTLAVASMLAAGWMRSFTIEDLVAIKYRHLDTFVASCGGCVIWHRTLDRENNPSDPPVSFVSIDVSFDGENRFDPWQGYDSGDIDWRRDWAGMSFGAGIDHGPEGARYPFKMWITPYWSLVLPLTLLSAWLILVRLRPSNSAKESSRG